MVVVLTHRRYKNQKRKKNSKWSGENNGEKSEKEGGSEREGTVESNSLKKGPRNTVTMACYGKGFQSQAI